MDETTPPERSKSVLFFSPVVLLVKGVGHGELVVSSSSPPVQWMEEGAELVCGTELTGRESSPTPTVPKWSEGGEGQGGGKGKAWQHNLPFKVEDNICSEPHFEGDLEVEPQTVAMQETEQT